MKVISGFLKGRNVKGFNLDGTRPTMDRVKESLFAIIQNYLDGSVVLDLFSGSGNLGIEAISNGSKLAYFNDLNKESIKVIKSNVDQFNINDKCIILNYDYNRCLEFLKNQKIKFDIVFLDPPYKDEILNDAINFIIENDMINNDGIIVCEVGNNYIKDFDLLEKIKEKRYGDKEIIILKYNN